MISDIHRRINSDQKETNPELVQAPQQLGIRSHNKGERLTVSKLVIAPFQKPFKDRMESFFWMPLKMSEDGDVTRVTNLFGQVGRVVNKLRLKKGVFLLSL